MKHPTPQFRTPYFVLLHPPRVAPIAWPSGGFRLRFPDSPFHLLAHAIRQS